jgi:hypothetical protein
MEPPPIATSPPKLVVFWRAALCLAVLWLGIAFEVPGARPDWAAPTAQEQAWGWDETMHAELPAVQMLLHTRRGEWYEAMEVVHECDRYPFAYPMALAAWQGIFGVSQRTARRLGSVLFGLLVLLAVGLGVQVVRRDRRLDTALFVALAAVSAPLARRYAPTLFLEVPALVLIACSLSVWIVRRRAEIGTKKRLGLDLAAGFLIAATFFTKFNYALLLGIAIGLDSLFELVSAKGQRGTWVSLVRTVLPLACGLAWWFLLPLPLGAEVAAEHRGDFMEFVTGNFEMKIERWRRITNWLTGVASHSFVFASLVGLGVTFLLRHRTRGGLTLGLGLLAFVVPIVSHPFQLDRFLLPAALVLWVVGGAGAAMFLRAAPRLFTACALGLGIACAQVPVITTAAWLGFPLVEEGNPVREFQEHIVGRALSLFGPPASNGLTRDVHEEIMDLIAEGVGTEDSVGWLGQSSEISPASLHLGLLERGGSAERFLQFAPGPMDIELLPSNVRTDFSQEELLAFARQFDYVVVPSVSDLMARGGRGWVAEAWHQPLRDWPDAEWRTLGSVVVDMFSRGALPVTLQLVSVPE